MLLRQEAVFQRGGIKMEGLWYAHFTAGAAHGDGLAVLRDGEILGGDPAHTYSGTYQSDGNHLYANVRVSPNRAATVPLDMDRPLMFFLKGSVAGDSATVAGHPDHNEELKIAVVLHRAE
jgi:hypothetical protein